MPGPARGWLTNRHPSIPLGAAPSGRDGRQGEATRSARGAGAGDPAGTLHRVPAALAQRDAVPHGLSPARTAPPGAPPGSARSDGQRQVGRAPGTVTARPRAGPDRRCSPWAAGRWSAERRGAQDRGAEGQTGRGTDRQRRERQRGERRQKTAGQLVRAELVNRAPGPRGAEQPQPSTPLPEHEPERGSLTFFPLPSPIF